MDIKLTPQEMMSAATIGAMRQLQNLRASRQDAYGASERSGWQYHIEGAMGECAVAKALNLYWNGNLGNLQATDVGELEVRTSSYKGGMLALHPKDKNVSIFIHVNGVNGKYKIHGWCYGKEGKKDIYWNDLFNNKRPAFFVPNSILKPIEELRSK